MSIHHNKCGKENIINQLVEVQAQVTVTPHVMHADPRVYCMNSYIQKNPDCCNNQHCNWDCCNSCNNDSYCHAFPNHETLKNKCSYTLTQIICVEIPIFIDADVDVKEGIVCCGKPNIIPL